MENVIKQGYLKKSRPTAPGSNPANSFLQLFEPTRWFVFILRNRRPYLDYYEKEQHVFSSQPINSFDLFTCTKVTYTLGRNNRNWTFCLFLQDRVLELTADSRDVMLSWCRTLEHTLQSYGALKHVPSEHIYSDYPVKYKPKKSASPPPLPNDRRATTPTPPPSEPAPPIPDEAFASKATNGMSRSISGTDYCNSGLVAPVSNQEPEGSELDTSEDDFVDEKFFEQKKMEAYASHTLKFNSSLNNPLGFQCRSATSLPRSFSLPSDSSENTPEIPLRPPRNKSGKQEYQYSQVTKVKSNVNSDSEGVYESAFEVGDKNSLVEQSGETSDDQDGVYEAAFDVGETRPLIEKRTVGTAVQLPKRISQFEELEKISNTKMTQNGQENLYSDFDSVMSNKTNESDYMNADGNYLASRTEKSDFDNNNTKKENTERSNDVSLQTGKDTKMNEKELNLYDNIDNALKNDTAYSHKMNGGNSYVELAYDASKTSPVKPPRKPSKKASKTDSSYVNMPLSELDPKQLDESTCHVQNIEAPTVSKSTRDKIYDFGKCTAPVKTSDKVKQASNNGYENMNSENGHIGRKSKLGGSKKYSLPPPLNIDLDYKRSNSSSPDTPRRTPTNMDPLQTKAGLLDLPPSPTSPSTPVNESNISFPKVHKTVVNVTKKRQSTPSPKRHSRPASNSPKVRHSDVVPQSTQDIPKLPTRISDPSHKESASHSKSSGQERPRSLEMASQYDFVKSQPVRKNTGEALYSPVLNRNWFGSQPMPGVGSKSVSNQSAQPIVLSQPITESSTDTTYEVPRRVRPVVQHEPQPTFIGSDYIRNSGSSSPSHDGFQFNVPSNKDEGNENGEDNNESHDYEDATGTRGEPPIPPRRNKSSSFANRSKSVYVPCNINPDPVRAGIVRQTSLRERQRISTTPGLVTVLPLKQSEIDIVKEEQQSHGIIVKITPAACHRIALVDCLNGVWIVGWDFKHYPRLSESVHIGDEVTKINEIRVTSAHMARKTLKGSNTDQVDLVIKRLPYAHVMAIRRHQNGEKLGLQRFGGTAEITYVDPGGLAAEHGLPKHAKSVEGENPCNWWITEINNRPLNLSFKGNEIECKLNAVGKDISIVVQPADFVKELKKQLKKMRNCKDYLAM